MTPSNFRYRGIDVVVDTTQPAEFDIAGFQLPESAVEAIANALRTVTFSEQDRCHGIARVRELDGYDVIFVVGREGKTVVITIAGVLRASDPSRTEELMERVQAIATLRGATGL